MTRNIYVTQPNLAFIRDSLRCDRGKAQFSHGSALRLTGKIERFCLDPPIVIPWGLDSGDTTMDAIFNEQMPRARLAVLLEHFSQIDDDRESWWVVYPLAEALLLLTCATIASCDDFEDSATVLGVSFRHSLRALAS